MTALWTHETAQDATGGKAQGSWQASRVEIDSRRIRPGDLFVALRGERFDGHVYAADALARGAAAAVISHMPENLPADAPLLIVGDTLKALEMLGRYARKRSRAKVVGVTGSVGKTSAKEMIRLALSAHGGVYATGGNYNNHIGTPLNLANLAPETPFAVFEMGMNHAGEIAHLTDMVRPHVAAITTVEAAHLEFFNSVTDIADAKSEIFQGVEEGGIAVINRDNPLHGVMAGHARACGIRHIVSFGVDEEADCRLLDYAATRNGSDITASIHGKSLHYSVRAIGRHWALTTLLTLAVTHALGLDDEKTARALAEFGELEGRGHLFALPLSGGEAVLIDDSYNASPAAMKAAFAKTAEVWESRGREGRRLAALGNMLEMGKDAPALHAALAPELERNGFDKVFTAGELMHHLHGALPPSLRGAHTAEAGQLLPVLRQELKPGDILLIKGSHGSHMYELAAALHASPSPLEGEGGVGGGTTHAKDQSVAATPPPNPLPQGEGEYKGKKHAV